METTINAEIIPLAPYDFTLTAGQPNYSRDQQFPTEIYADDTYRRLLDLGDCTMLASVHSIGAVEQPRLAVTLTGDLINDDAVARALAQLRWLLGCDQDLRPFYQSVLHDPVLSEMVSHFYGYRSTLTASVFEALVQAVLGQQVATSVSRIVRNLLIQHYGVRATYAGQEWYAFPRPEALAAAAVDDLRQLKLSVRKSEYIQGIAQNALHSPDGFEDLHSIPDDEAVARMTAIRGVGRWTAQWVLVRALARDDGFPIGDLALRRTVSALYFDGASLDDTRLLDFSQRWKPWRSLATSYLFAALRAGRITGP